MEEICRYKEDKKQRMAFVTLYVITGIIILMASMAALWGIWENISKGYFTWSEQAFAILISIMLFALSVSVLYCAWTMKKEG